MTTTDAAVEAAAWALHSDGCPYDECDGGCGGFRREAEVAVRAALPHLLVPLRALHTENLWLAYTDECVDPRAHEDHWFEDDCGELVCPWCPTGGSYCDVCRAFDGEASDYPCPTIRICNELEGKTQ